ncbi:ester cyclase [Nocardioides speluncae]|uniref:ester cyclase n=1 Tax=Nocardioides speluncae TaxID=2670337 RepID=UPI000D69702D|nr:ester cyclase [Nocardioides speluncae]
MSHTDLLARAWADASGPSGFGPEFDAVFSPDYVRHSGDSTLNKNEYRAVVADLYAAFPDLTMTILDAVEQGDRVAFRWESTGTHTGSYYGVPPTNRRITARGMTISRFEDDRIVEDWTTWDKASVLDSLGIIQLR